MTMSVIMKKFCSIEPTRFHTFAFLRFGVWHFMKKAANVTKIVGDDV